MEKSLATVNDIVNRPGFDPNQQGAEFWYEVPENRTIDKLDLIESPIIEQCIGLHGGSRLSAD